MAVIYELRGKPAEFGDLGLNLYYGCAVGCRYCYDIFLNRTTWERWTRRGRERRFCLEIERDAKKMAGDPRRSLFVPRATPINRKRQPG